MAIIGTDRGKAAGEVAAQRLAHQVRLHAAPLAPPMQAD
jgi:hypothetical protein